MAKPSHNELPKQMRPIEVGKRLVRLREINDLSATDVCRIAEIDNSAYTKYEKGARLLPPHKAYLLSRLFGVDLDFLLTGDTSDLKFDIASKLGLLGKK